MTDKQTVHPGRSVLAISGPDRATMLQGLITNDITHLNKGPLYTAMLSPQGKYLYDFHLIDHNETLYLTPETKYIEELMKKLRLYKLRSDASLEPKDDWRVCYGESAVPDTVSFLDPRIKAIGIKNHPYEYISLGPQLKINASGSAAQYDETRYALGVPEGADELGYDKGILLENGFDELQAIGWNKGCYLGQELTARTKHRGIVRKRLLPISWSDQKPSVGDRLFIGETPAGRIKAVGDFHGLAMVRLDPLKTHMQKGLPLTTDKGLPIGVKVPSWMVLPAGDDQDNI